MAKKKTTRRAAKSRVSSKKKVARVKVARNAKKGKAAKRAKKPALSAKAQLKRNKKIAVAFYDTIMNKKDVDQAVKYIGHDYLQHNPTAESGIQGLRDWMGTFHTSYPDLQAIVRRVVAEDDIVVLHNESLNGPGGHRATIDMFRLKDGKIIEHWDVIQVIPPITKHNNTMF
jgi:predicted SnoaL-like aldol condensation-catalyzing enzyme